MSDNISLALLLLNTYFTKGGPCTKILNQTVDMQRGFPGGASGKQSTCQCRRCKRHRFSSLHWKDPLEEDMATQSSILAWRIPWSEEPGGLWSVGSQRVGHDWSNLARMHTYILRMPPASHRKKNLFPVDIIGVFFRLHGGDFSQGSTINGDTNPSHPSFFTPGRI